VTNNPTDSGDLKIVVGSLNEAKVTAVKQAFTQVFGKVLVEGITIKDTLSQPTTDSSTLHGAEHRAQSAKFARPDADYWVGIEGGVESVAGELMVMAWVVIMTTDQVGRSRSATYQLPKPAAAAVEAGQPLGDISAKVVGDNWQRLGLIASLSRGRITRTSFYIEPIILALLPFLDSWMEVSDDLRMEEDASSQ
jgi:inosine/xanthosine triphosphatase